MRTFYLLHDHWYQYVKADLLASQYPVDGFVVIRRKRDLWYRYLGKRAKRIGFFKVLDELVLRLYWTVFKSWGDHRDLTELKPDVCVLMLHPILSKKTFTIPPLGMLVFHPGVTPEYRGPHSAFWATMNNEFWGIGWSLLRVDEGIDTRPVMAQGSCGAVDPIRQ